MSEFKPENFSYEKSEEKTTTKSSSVIVKKQRLGFDATDIIAFSAAIVAILFTIGMLVGKFPVNDLTISVVGFSGVSAAIARIIKSKRKANSTKKTN